MRLRNIKGSREEIAVNEFVIHEPESYKGHWNEYFHNDYPIHIEIGMGKGKFITELAALHPDINYIGIEKYSSVLIRAIEKRTAMECSNLYFLRLDAENLNEIFGENEISKIYLNFSDPWPKDRHAKRRLTSKEFLARYGNCLIPDGVVVFKTDNVDLFDFSLKQVPLASWKIRDFTRDLHHSESLEGNVMTEYEERFVAEGKPIHRMTIYR